MKKLFLLPLAIALIFCTSVSAQSRISEKDLIGRWKLVIEIREAIEEERDDSDEETAFEKIILSATSGLVGGILDNVDIELEFFKGGDATVLVDAFGDEEIEKTSWRLKDGKLYIDDTDSFQMDSGDYWMLKGGILVSYEDDELNEYVYMKPLN